jgi:hypothetical protein
MTTNTLPPALQDKTTELSFEEELHQLDEVQPSSPLTKKAESVAPTSTENEKKQQESDALAKAEEAKKKAAETATATEAEKKKQQEAEAAQAEEEKKKLAEAQNATAIPEPLKKLFPDAKALADIVPAIEKLQNDLHEETSANAELVQILDANPLFIDVLRDLKEGKTWVESIRERFQIPEGGIPDPATDPKGYEAYVKKMLQTEEEQKKKVAAAKEDETRMQAIRESAVNMREEFKTKMKMSDDDLKAFLNFVKAQTQADSATGKLPDNYLDVFYKAYKYDQDVAKAKADGIIEGRNEAITKLKKDGTIKGDALPDLRTGKTITETPKSDELDDLEHIVSSSSRVFPKP